MSRLESAFSLDFFPHTSLYLLSSPLPSPRPFIPTSPTPLRMLLPQKAFTAADDWIPGAADAAFRIGLGRANTPELLARLSRFVESKRGV